MKKVLHFFPDNHAWGGIEVYLQSTLSRLQQRKGYEVVAAVTDGGPLARQLLAAGIKVRTVPVHIKAPVLRTLDFRVLGSLLQILREEKPDLVHIHKGRIEQSVIKIAGFPLVYTYHSYGGLNNLETAPNRVIRGIAASARFLLSSLTGYLNGMTVVSDYERQRLYREGFLPVHFQAEVLHNGLPTQTLLENVQEFDITALREALQIQSQARIISFICRLAPDKNAEAFLRIARRLLTDSRLQYPVHFLVAGDGKLASVFQDAFAHDPLLKGQGQYLGFRQDVPQLIKASTLTISTSLQEGFGLRVLESLLFGKPCITYAAGGIPEVMSLPEASPWLVPLHDEAAFAEQLLQTINLPQDELDRLVPMLQAHARRFDIETHVQGLEDFYHRTFQKLAIASPSQSNSAGRQSESQVHQG